MRKIFWWCPGCEVPQYTYGNLCTECGHKCVNSWRCVKCLAVVDAPDCRCGNTRKLNYGSMRLDEQLAKTLPGESQTVLQRLRDYIKYTAYRKRIPEDVADDAFCAGLERLVKGIDSFDLAKGNFLAWSMRVMRNALMTVARDDTIKNDGVLSLDGAIESDGSDGNEENNLINHLVGDELSMGTFAEIEERKELASRMSSIARREFGSAHIWIGLEWTECDIYDLCVDAYAENERGWLALVSRKTGVPKYTLSRRKARAKEAWDRWQDQEKEMKL